MKKRLEDFTEEEIEEICSKYATCKNCPFRIDKEHISCYADDRETYKWKEIEI